jgi:hypothetical protein
MTIISNTSPISNLAAIADNTQAKFLIFAIALLSRSQSDRLSPQGRKSISFAQIGNFRCIVSWVNQ